MSISVEDPSGGVWTVSREWFGIPRWAKEESPSADLSRMHHLAGDWGVGEHLWVVIAIAIIGVVVLVLVLFLLPLLVLFLGILVAAFALVARLLGLSAWTVQARGEGQTLSWRVRGLVRSARGVRAVASSLARGEEPLLEGRPPDVVDPIRV